MKNRPALPTHYRSIWARHISAAYETSRIVATGHTRKVSENLGEFTKELNI